MRSISGYTRLTKVHKFSAAGIAAAGVAAVALAVVPASAEDEKQAIAVKPVAWNAKAFGTEDQRAELVQQSDDAADQARKQAEAKKKAEAEAKAKADKERAEKEAASRSAERKPVKAEPAAPAAPAAPAPKTYADNLDGWIREALDIMAAKGIPGSYDGIHRNIMRESTGNPNAINNWDSNAAAGIPSKGLLQVIDPTFQAYHVEGTSWNIYDPVANITAACNYAAKVYGSMDNVNSAY
ncbi:transglycosylase SLT domain-containing protein [Streptomyces sp. AV19]|uniref:transglycosylase SLT domain-containing protein n=1 Tax=Streptomyces sp. AV19 TaxID=2793068 RepID=UPI0018FE51C9|nr:transglycosylase SLT domain-containing protein [Streptomyces sp. AV19]MBH1936516.1 transglycosylase SLT domain-containing protein [Streptomyces sp. AV19]MDG4532575.1 transglycosylase SLT domain-containing protein [Streptomyces sp. AV19]